MRVSWSVETTRRSVSSCNAAMSSPRFFSRKLFQRSCEAFGSTTARSSLRRRARATRDGRAPMTDWSRPLFHSPTRSCPSSGGGGPAGERWIQPERRMAARPTHPISSSRWALDRSSRGGARRRLPASTCSPTVARIWDIGLDSRSAISWIVDIPSHCSRKSRVAGSMTREASWPRGMSKGASVAAAPVALSSMMRACSSSTYSTVSPGPHGSACSDPPMSTDTLVAGMPLGMGSGPGSKRKWRFGASSIEYMPSSRAARAMLSRRAFSRFGCASRANAFSQRCRHICSSSSGPGRRKSCPLCSPSDAEISSE